MKPAFTKASFEHLQFRVDRIENVLCDLVMFSDKEKPLYPQDLKKCLEDSGIVDAGK